MQRLPQQAPTAPSRAFLAGHLAPAVLSWWLLAAHFFRMGLLAPTALCGLAPLSFALRGNVTRVVSQVAMLVGAALWLHTASTLVAARQATGQPWLRLVVILGAVAAFHLLSAALLQRQRMRAWFRASLLGRLDEAGDGDDPPS